MRKADFNFRRGREEGENLPSFPLVIPCRYYGIQALTRGYSAVKIRLQQYGQECCTSIFMTVLSSMLSKGKLFENTYRTSQKYRVLLRAQLAWQKKRALFLFLLSESYRGFEFCSNTLKTVITVVAQINRGGEEELLPPCSPWGHSPVTEDHNIQLGGEKREFLCKKIQYFRMRSAATTWILLVYLLFNRSCS